MVTSRRFLKRKKLAVLKLKCVMFSLPGSLQDTNLLDLVVVVVKGPPMLTSPDFPCLPPKGPAAHFSTLALPLPVIAF